MKDKYTILLEVLENLKNGVFIRRRDFNGPIQYY